MKPWERRKVDELCAEISGEVPDVPLSDLTPTTLAYGQEGDPGTTGEISRADHRHALSSALYGAFPTVILDLCTNSPSQNTQVKLLNNIYGSNSGLIGDDPGTSGAFGLGGVNFALGGSGTNSHVALSNANPGSGTGNTTDRVHSVARMLRLNLRVLTRSTTVPASYKAAVGGIHETLNADIDTIDDGVYFFIEKDGSGNGNWRAIAKSSTTGLTTDIDTGVAPAATAAGAFQRLEFTYDLTTLTYLIDDIVVAEVTENIPDLKLFGWGLWAEKTAAAPSAREVWLDDVVFVGRF